MKCSKPFLPLPGSVLVIMLKFDIKWNDSLTFFYTFLTTSDEHTETVTLAMETIMAVLLEESEEIGEDLLLIVLSCLGRDKKVSLSLLLITYVFF